jgi:hypothetical protein
MWTVQTLQSETERCGAVFATKYRFRVAASVQAGPCSRPRGTTSSTRADADRALALHAKAAGCRLGANLRSGMPGVSLRSEVEVLVLGSDRGAVRTAIQPAPDRPYRYNCGVPRPRTQAVYYRAPDGSEPVADFLDGSTCACSRRSTSRSIG